MLQPAQWRAKVSELTGLPLDKILVITQGWNTVQRDKVLKLLEACHNNDKLSKVMNALNQHRESGSPSVKKLLADVDEALL